MTEACEGTTDAITYKDLAFVTYNDAINLYKCLSDQRIKEPAGDPPESLKLSLNLNYAVFLKECKGQGKQGLRILKREIANALDDYDKWDDETPKIKQQVELIQENINLWKE